MVRTFIIAAVSGATMFSSAAFTQGLSKDTASNPDFSGMWSYPYWPSFELPLSGPGPVRFNAELAEGSVPDPAYKGKGLQLQFTVEDEGVFTTPWSATITYRRASLTDWGETVCAENIHEYYARKDTSVPRSDKPDF
jgi:hypothetical protein